LPARQRSALILCEVLKWPAAEVAELLETSVASVNSALQRARATLAAADLTRLDAVTDPEHEALLARYVDAFERYDMDALAALLRDDVVLSMPPYDLWLQGAGELLGWFVGPGHGCRGSRLVPVALNGSAGFGSYRQTRPGLWERLAFQLPAGPTLAGRHVRCLGRDEDGELYVVTSAQSGPTGTTAEVWKLVP